MAQGQSRDRKKRFTRELAGFRGRVLERLECRYLLSAGLVDTVWHPDSNNPNLNDNVFGGTNGALASVAGYAASHASSAAYSFVNTADQFNYSGGQYASTPSFLGADAAGGAAGDTANVTDTIFDAEGYFVTTIAGAYTISTGGADDIFGAYVGGNGTPGSGTLVTASGWQGATSPLNSINLPANSSIPIEMIYGNGYGGAFLQGVSIADPSRAPVAYSTSIVPGDPLPAATPSTLNASAGNGQVALSWNTAIFAVSYSVYRSDPNHPTPTLMQSGITGLSYVDGTSANNTTYSYYITSDSASGSAQSNSVIATPAAPTPAPAVNVLTHHNDAANDGSNASETVLSPANVNPSDFGKQFTANLDGGFIAAQPLYEQNLNITRGSSPGDHSVVFAATEADGLYALDASSGAVLWHDNFTNVADPTNLTPTTGVTTIARSDIANNPDVGPTLGILATPVIDPATGILYLNANTKEIRSDGQHFVQRLWAINTADGTAATSSPAVIGDTIANGGLGGQYRYVSGPIINGTGNNNPTGHATPVYPNTDGWTSAPGGATGYVVAFNAVLQMERTAVSLINGQIYLGFASHGDDGPYYGWVLGYNKQTLALTAAFNTTPTYEPSINVQSSQPYQSEGGVWMAGSNISTDGTYLYLTTGNGAFNGNPSNFDAQGFAKDHDYGDTLLKLAVDPNSTPGNQNGSGWGLKVADYFTPSNQFELNKLDIDLGSGGVTLLPSNLLDAAGNPMAVVGGKESRVYLLDRNNLGKFNPTYPQTSTTADPRLYDNVLGEYANNGIDNVSHQIYSSAAYYNGNFYIGAQGDPAIGFSVGNFAPGTTPPGTSYTPPVVKTSLSFGYPAETFEISSDGNSGGVAWALNPGGSDLVAYDASNFVNAIYDSNTNSADHLNASVHFNVPTEANGMTYVGTSNGTLLGYGLSGSYLFSNAGYFGAPTGLIATAASASNVHLTWQSNSSMATEFRVDRSPDGASNWTTLEYVGNSWNSYDDTTVVSANTNYYYRVVAISGTNATAPSNIADLQPALVSVVSRKQQGIAGTFDINLPPGATTTPGLGIEDRIGGPTQLVLTFASPIALGVNIGVTLSSGSVSSTSPPVANANTLTINLSGAADGQTLVVNVAGVQDAGFGGVGSFGIDVGVLYGDVNGSGAVNGNDVNAVRVASGMPVTQQNFRDDVNCSGSINGNDINAVRVNSGNSLAAPIAPVVLSHAVVEPTILQRSTIKPVKSSQASQASSLAAMYTLPLTGSMVDSPGGLAMQGWDHRRRPQSRSQLIAV